MPLGGKRFSQGQQLRFPLMMAGILGGIFTFWWTFSSVNEDRIKLGSKKFTHQPEVNFYPEKK